MQTSFEIWKNAFVATPSGYDVYCAYTGVCVERNFQPVDAESELDVYLQYRRMALFKRTGEELDDMWRKWITEPREERYRRAAH